MSEEPTVPTSKPAKSTRGKGELEKVLEKMVELNDALYQTRRKSAFSDLKKYKLSLEGEVISAQRQALIDQLQAGFSKLPE